MSLFLRKKEGTNPEPFVFLDNQGDLQTHSGEEWAVLGVEMEGASVVREGIAVENVSPDMWHVLLLLLGWTVSESCQEGLHHHF